MKNNNVWMLQMVRLIERLNRTTRWYKNCNSWGWGKIEKDDIKDTELANVSKDSTCHTEIKKTKRDRKGR